MRFQSAPGDPGEIPQKVRAATGIPRLDRDPDLAKSISKVGNTRFRRRLACQAQELNLASQGYEPRAGAGLAWQRARRTERRATLNAQSEGELILDRPLPAVNG